ncbi:hypothetical protein LSCM1_07626 [Leishmania martiniquensis]|uniref:Uncharacterized protein n=1 Tax=Leishmania martiniquensis TaxID=1580590 RepID=A0A836KSC0_9TRYP|nr:hypothetical protein LSCM1_07626 [Leishmania martiniquensis]
MECANTALGSAAQNVERAPSADGGAHAPGRSASEAAEEMQQTPGYAPLGEEKASKAAVVVSATPSPLPQDPPLAILPTPTPPLTAQGPLMARRPAPYASLTLASVTVGAKAADAFKATGDTLARPIESPSCAVRMSSCVPVQRPSFAAPRPVLHHNSYGMEGPRHIDRLHSGSHARRRETSSHASAQELLSRRDALMYDACATRLRVVQQERQALAKKMKASRQELERMQALLGVWHEKPEQPLAAAQGEQAEKDEARELGSGSAMKRHETARMVKQLRALDRVNDELRQRYEVLEQEKRRYLIVHHARLRRPAPAAVACDESRACARSTTFAHAAQALEARLAAAMAQQQALRQELALAMAKEHGRIKASADLQARGFAVLHTPEPCSGVAASGSREAAA